MTYSLQSQVFTLIALSYLQVETAFVECNVCSSIQDLLELLGNKVTTTWNMLLQQAKPPKRLIMSPPREAIKWCQYHVSYFSYFSLFSSVI